MRRSARLARLLLTPFLGAAPLVGCTAAHHASDLTRVEATTPISVGLEVRAGRSKLPGGRELELPVAVDVRADSSSLLRPPLDVSLVFDTSGSMAEHGKISYTLVAAKLLIQNLTPQDTLSIVTFGTDVTVLERQQPALRKLFLAHWFDELEPGGFTNLSGGLLAGLAELRRERRPGAHAHVILLTDGLANRGVTDLASLVSIAMLAGGEGISIATMGVGGDLGANFLVALAEASGGRHQHVVRAEDIPAAMAREVEALPLAAQNVELELVPSEGTELLDPGASDIPAQVTRAPAEEPSFTALGDLFAGERRSVYAIARLRPGAPSGARPILIARLRYQNARGETVTTERILSLDVASDGDEAEETADEALLGEMHLARLLDLAYRALVSRDHELAEVAQQRIADGARDLDALARHGETEAIKEQAALVAHLGEELAKLEAGEQLHGHEDGGGVVDAASEALFRRYLLLHHRRADSPERVQVREAR